MEIALEIMGCSMTHGCNFPALAESVEISELKLQKGKTSMTINSLIKYPMKDKRKGFTLCI